MTLEINSKMIETDDEGFLVDHSLILNTWQREHMPDPHDSFPPVLKLTLVTGGW